MHPPLKYWRKGARACSRAEKMAIAAFWVAYHYAVGRARAAPHGREGLWLARDWRPDGGRWRRVPSTRPRRRSRPERPPRPTRASRASSNLCGVCFFVLPPGPPGPGDGGSRDPPIEPPGSATTRGRVFTFASVLLAGRMLFKAAAARALRYKPGTTLIHLCRTPIARRSPRVVPRR